MTKCFWEGGVFEFPGPVRVLYAMPAKGRKRALWREVGGTDGHLSDDNLVLYQNGEEINYPFQYEYQDVGDVQVIQCIRVDTDPPVVWENSFSEYRIGSSLGLGSHGVRDEIARAYILESMHRAIVDDVEPEYGPANARVDLEAWIAVRESTWQSHQWIDLPLKNLTSVEQAIQKEYIRRYGRDPTEQSKISPMCSSPAGVCCGISWVGCDSAGRRSFCCQLAGV